MADYEVITIERCPRCPNSHRYRLAVQRSILLKMFTMDDMTEQLRPVRVTRLFTCPTTNEDYEARIVLYDDSGNRIKQVGQVLGLAKHDD
jgi:hypothetical protein